MNYLSYVKNGIDELSIEIDTHPLPKEDLRPSYLDHMFSVFDLFYRQCCAVYAANIIKNKSIELTKSELSVIEVFLGSVSNNTTFQSVMNSINRALLVDSWSTFEFFLTYLCDSLFDNEVKNELLIADSKEIIKIISRYTISDTDVTKIKKRLSKPRFAHVSVNRKYEKLHSMFESNYSGDWAEDKLFLEFYGKYRNCIHSNFIYHGNDKEYEFLGTKYWFADGKAVAHDKLSNIKEMFDLAVKLKDTCRRLFDAVQHKELLQYPASEVVQP